ncbi:ADAMTS-like protein 5 isoform X2 [Sceloporus undulatus]|uniref:ADAMTS-like protein 5 isoform X2 n=1 Tax=Sceloporus undulatus TaxID=8520 RepID=UPI001C4DBB1F|nr:ADAMTS-like protein 5 isoform X2 [Sceloporus undulatus]
MWKGRGRTTVVAPEGLPDSEVWRWGSLRGLGQEWTACNTPRSAWPVSSSWHLLIMAWLTVTCTAQGTDPRTPGFSPAPKQPQPSSEGAWTHWGGWSACSSTCGDGASFRTRRCIRFPEEQPCRGKPRQYRACDLHECPAGSVPFRAIQCALYNGRSVLGGQTPYQWVPFHGAPNLCDLNCLAVGHNFYYTFGRVLDGTRCSPESRDLCISGRCLRVGCDGTLGSEAQVDVCGVCNGRNETCLFVQQVFRAAFPTSGFFGYKNVTRIPAGARHIKVTDRSRNYLALMNANQRYVINGDWAIDWPGVYEVAGTKVQYTRTADVHESFEAAGPTQEDLSVMVLFQAPNPGIEYEFWLPREPSHPMQSDASPLRQPQTREAEGDVPAGPLPFPEDMATVTPQGQHGTKEVAKQYLQEELEPAPTLPRAPFLSGRCGKCNTPKGKSQRIHHYCSSDFVFRARILSKRHIGQETRYDLQVKQTYRNRYPLVHREYVWVPDTCECPLLAERREYVLMARRHVNFEHTLNRILLPRGGYARPWTPREDLQLRDLAGRCEGSPSSEPRQLSG